MLVWETIIETSDTTMVSTEWAMYELAKDQERQVINFSCSHTFFLLLQCRFFTHFQLMAQDRLYREIVDVCGTNKVTEENVCKLPYLSAVFHETLRRHSPVPVVPLRYVHEDTQLGGYFVPAGTEVITFPHSLFFSLKCR